MASELDLKSVPKEVWIGAGVLAIGYIWWSRRNDSETPTEDMIDTGGVAGVGVGGSGMWTDVTPGVDQDDAPTIAVTTNTDWRRKATTALVDKNYPPALADEAMTRYLNGMVLSPAQGVMVSEAIRAIGPVPEDLPPGPVVPIPGSTPTSNPSTAGTAIVNTKLPAPKNVRATKIEKSSITIAWDAVPNAKSYQLDRSGDNLKYGTTQTSITITGLKPGTKYNMIVRAVSSVNVNGSWSPTQYFTTKK